MDNVDFGRHSEDYATYRPGFPASFYQRLDGFAPIRGSRSVDLATGPGTIALELAALGSSVVGIDVSTGQVATARRVAEGRNLADRAHFGVARAESTGLAAGTFDLATAGQCWHWFDRPAAAAEVQRVLKPSGRLVICHFDWIPLPGNVVAATEALIEAHNPHWAGGGGTGLHAAWLADAAQAGFTAIETFSFDHDAVYSHAAWRGRVRASAGVGASLAPKAVDRFDAAHETLLAERFPDDPLHVPHRAWTMLATAR